MKISKLLSKAYLPIFIILISVLTSNVVAEEELVDIWKIEKKIENENKIKKGEPIKKIEKIIPNENFKIVK